MQDEIRDRRLLADHDLETLLAVQYERMGEFARLHRLSDQERQDVVQQAIMRHWRELQAGRTYDDVPLRVVARKLVQWAVLDLIGESRRRREHEYPLPDGWEIGVEDPTPGLDEYDMKARMAVLTEGERRVASMMYLEGMTHDEIAMSLGMTRNAVDQALHRARKRMKASWHG